MIESESIAHKYKSVVILRRRNFSLQIVLPKYQYVRLNHSIEFRHFFVNAVSIELKFTHKLSYFSQSLISFYFASIIHLAFRATLKGSAFTKKFNFSNHGHTALKISKQSYLFLRFLLY